MRVVGILSGLVLSLWGSSAFAADTWSYRLTKIKVLNPSLARVEFTVVLNGTDYISDGVDIDVTALDSLTAADQKSIILQSVKSKITSYHQSYQLTQILQSAVGTTISVP